MNSSYRQLLSQYWSWIKSLETGLEFVNYLTLLQAGRKGRAAARPRVGRELNTFHSDFLTWNSLGAILSVMQLIIVGVEVILLPAHLHDCMIVYYFAVLPIAEILVTLGVQCGAVSLDLVPWRACPTPREFAMCTVLWLTGARGGRKYGGVAVGRYRNLFRDDSEDGSCGGNVPVTAQTSVCSAASTYMASDEFDVENDVDVYG